MPAGSEPDNGGLLAAGLPTERWSEGNVGLAPDQDPRAGPTPATHV